MAVSIDRYIGVTQPLTYSRIMTIRRTIYLILIVWAISILTSVVPLFGMTDRGKKSSETGDAQTCTVNKNTFYTIFSSLISFYIPVIILLILYSRVYQEAKKQGEKLEKEKRRLYQIDYQAVCAQVQQQQQQHHANGHTKKNSCQYGPSDNAKIDVLPIPLSINHIPDEECCLDRAVTSTDVDQSRPDYPDRKVCVENEKKKKKEISFFSLNTTEENLQGLIEQKSIGNMKFCSN